MHLLEIIWNHLLNHPDRNNHSNHKFAVNEWKKKIRKTYIRLWIRQKKTWNFTEFLNAFLTVWYSFYFVWYSVYFIQFIQFHFQDNFNQKRKTILYQIAQVQWNLSVKIRYTLYFKSTRNTFFLNHGRPCFIYSLPYFTIICISVYRVAQK